VGDITNQKASYKQDLRKEKWQCHGQKDAVEEDIGICVTAMDSTGCVFWVSSGIKSYFSVHPSRTAPPAWQDDISTVVASD